MYNIRIGSIFTCYILELSGVFSFIYFSSHLCSFMFTFLIVSTFLLESTGSPQLCSFKVEKAVKREMQVMQVVEVRNR